MTVFDSRGRVFGLINLIDLAIGVALVAVAGLGAAAYRVFEIPDPVLERVEPAEVVGGASPHVTLVGQHLRHYLRAFVPRTGEPFAVTPAIPDAAEARFESVTEDRVELALPTRPPLMPGQYDLYLFDDTKRIAYRRAAFTVVPPPYPRGRMEIHMYAYLYPENPGLVKPGDQDTLIVVDPALPAMGAAAVTDVRVTPQVTSEYEIAFGEYKKGAPYEWIGSGGTRLVVDVTLDVPVLAIHPGRWEYKKAPVRVGERLTVGTAKYTVTGPIISVGEVQPWR